MAFALRTMLTWLVMGPVSSVLRTEKGGRASNTWVLPVSFRVNQTCEPSGVAAMLGQKGLAWCTFPTTLWSATEMTSVSGLNDEQTYPYFPSGEKIVMPGPLGTVIRVFSSYVAPSRTDT